MAARIMIAIKPGTVTIDGQRRMVRKGVTTAHDGHDLVRRYPHLWKPITPDYPVNGADAASDGAVAELLAGLRARLHLDDDASMTEILDALDEVLDGRGPDTVDATTLADRHPAPVPVDVGDTDEATERARIREWAANQGIEVSPRGRIPAAVVDRYRAAADEMVGGG